MRVALPCLMGIALGAAGCVSVANPGHFTPGAPRPGAPDSGLVARPTPWDMVGGGPRAITDRFSEDMTAHLAAAGLFAALQDVGADVELRGTLLGLCEPLSVFHSPVPCASHQTFGYAYSAMAALLSFGLWPAVTLFGVPTDGGTAEAALALEVVDPSTGVTLARWQTGEVEATAYAGLYYRGAPLAEALRAAADALVAAIRPEVRALEGRVRALKTWPERYPPGVEGAAQALGDAEAAIRCRALQALARAGASAASVAPQVRALGADAEAPVRRQVVDTLAALGDLSPPGLATLAELSKDRDDDVAAAAQATHRRLTLLALAQALHDPEVARLADPEARVEALAALGARGAAARPALPAVVAVLEASDAVALRRAAVDALLAIGLPTPEVRAALAAAAHRGDEAGRAAGLALAQLQARPLPPPPAPPPPTEAAPAPRAVVAVFPIAGGQLRPTRRAALTELLTAHLTAAAGFQVVPTAQLAARLRAEKAESYRACYDEACQLEIGKAVAAEKVLSTKLIPQGKTCLVSATLYDLRTEATEAAAVVEGRCGAEELAATLRAVAQTLAAKR